MKKFIILTLSLLLASCSSGGDSTDTTPTPTPTEDSFIRAADMSFVPEIEASGFQYKNNNTKQAPLLTQKNVG